MAVRLKKLSKQVMVVTGASSGIGLATARRAAEAGAKVVLAARNDAALSKAVAGIRAKGGTATYVAADVRRRADVEKIADVAERAYGHIDTWVNDAGLSVFGQFDRIPDSDARTLFDVNYWGLVYGSLTAVAAMRARGCAARGGAAWSTWAAWLPTWGCRSSPTIRPARPPSAASRTLCAWS